MSLCVFLLLKQVLVVYPFFCELYFWIKLVPLMEKVEAMDGTPVLHAQELRSKLRNAEAVQTSL